MLKETNIHQQFGYAYVKLSILMRKEFKQEDLSIHFKRFENFIDNNHFRFRLYGSVIFNESKLIRFLKRGCSVFNKTTSITADSFKLITSPCVYRKDSYFPYNSMECQSFFIVFISFSFK